jgi:hypothetical protein
MSNSGDVWQDDGNAQAKPPRPKSSKLRVILIILGVCGLCCVLCCGVAAYMISGLIPVTTPEGVRKKTQEIVAIEIPDHFKPVMAMNIFGQVRIAMYQESAAPDDGMLMLMGFSKNLQQEQNADQQMREAMSKQGQQEIQMDEDKTETREFTIRGEKCKFVFGEGKKPNSETEFHQVYGAFPANGGGGMLMLQLSADEYDEAEIVKMIESIH